MRVKKYGTLSHNTKCYNIISYIRYHSRYYHLNPLPLELTYPHFLYGFFVYKASESSTESQTYGSSLSTRTSSFNGNLHINLTKFLCEDQRIQNLFSEKEVNLSIRVKQYSEDLNLIRHINMHIEETFLHDFLEILKRSLQNV